MHSAMLGRERTAEYFARYCVIQQKQDSENLKSPYLQCSGYGGNSKVHRGYIKNPEYDMYFKLAKYGMGLNQWEKTWYYPNVQEIFMYKKNKGHEHFVCVKA